MPEEQANREAVARIVYASQSAITGSVYAEMERIRAAALRNNAPLGVHTALLYQCGWFVQWKEGPGDALLGLMARVESDGRHHSMRIVHSSRGPRLLTGPWSMAIVQAGDAPGDMTHRVVRLRRGLDEGRQLPPPAVWRQLSTPMRHPGATEQADPEAFQRLLVCCSSGLASFELVQWLAKRNALPVVHRRFAGDEGLDVGTDYVDFQEGSRVLRVIAMARKGLLLPLTRAFLSDYSHIVLLLDGDAEHDRILLHKVAHACAHLPSPPALLGVAASPRSHQQAFAIAHRAGLIYLETHADPQDVAGVWHAAQPLLACWREAANSDAAPLSRPIPLTLAR